MKSHIVERYVVSVSLIVWTRVIPINLDSSVEGNVDGNFIRSKEASTVRPGTQSKGDTFGPNVCGKRDAPLKDIPGNQDRS
jgi:hypothetical protein